MLAPLDEVVHAEEEADRHGPLLDEPERPEEGHAGEIPEEERRIAERREAAAHVGDHEDEEEHRVRHVLPLGIDLEDESDEEHRRPGRPDDRSQDPAQKEESRVRRGVRGNVARDADARGDDVQRAEEKDEGDVLVRDVAEAFRPGHDDRQGRERGHDRLKAGPAPPAGDGERQDRDREEESGEGQEPEDGSAHPLPPLQVFFFEGLAAPAGTSICAFWIVPE